MVFCIITELISCMTQNLAPNWLLEKETQKLTNCWSFALRSFFAIVLLLSRLHFSKVIELRQTAENQPDQLDIARLNWLFLKRQKQNDRWQLKPAKSQICGRFWQLNVKKEHMHRNGYLERTFFSGSFRKMAHLSFPFKAAMADIARTQGCFKKAWAVWHLN